MRQTREGCKCRCSIDRPNEVKMGLLTMTINELSKVVLHAAASNIHKSFHLDYHTAEDIASEAAAYALKGIQESGSLAVEKEWINKTIWKARNITKDRIKKLSNPDELLILDQSFVDENGKAFDDSPTLTKAAITKFATGNTTCELEKQENEQESRNLYKEERNREMQFVCNNYAQRSAGIFIARAFKHLSIADICKKFDTTPNAVSVIVSRIKEDVSIHKMIEDAKRTGFRLPNTNFRKLRDPAWRTGRQYIHKEKSDPTRHSSDPEVIYGKAAWTEYLSRNTEIEEKSPYIAHDKYLQLRKENFERLKKNAKK